jgi:molecular chaperone GrpE (heat shock protein)
MKIMQMESKSFIEELWKRKTQDLAKEKDKYLRLFAEFENHKRRTQKRTCPILTRRGFTSEMMISIKSNS